MRAVIEVVFKEPVPRDLVCTVRRHEHERTGGHLAEANRGIRRLPGPEKDVIELVQDCRDRPHSPTNSEKGVLKRGQADAFSQEGRFLTYLPIELLGDEDREDV